MVDTDAVFHAPMFALNADVPLSACDAEPHAVHCRRKGLARFGADASAPEHALMDAHVGTYVVQVRIVDTFIYVAILIDIDLCIHHMYIYI